MHGSAVKLSAKATHPQIRFGFDANQKAWSMHHIAQDST
jgi:hypothetical protein